jgi:hypothetical protein
VSFKASKAQLTIEEENSPGQEQESRFLQRTDESHRAERALDRRDSGAHAQICENEQRQDEKSADPHRPAKADFRNQMNYHDGKDDPA